MAIDKIKTFLLISSALIITASLIKYPEVSVEAAKSGLMTWGTIVFPSLLPFFIISEVLIGLGVVTFLGVLLEPVMRPLFRVPGTGGFVWAMGMASGYPAGAKFTARLRQERQISAIEAERLASFTNFSNPLFMFAAVAYGFFGKEELGLLIAACHYLGNFCVGLCMRYHGRDYDDRWRGRKKRVSIRQTFHLFHEARMRDRRPFGQLLGDAVRSSISTLLMIGGFIILFSVINQLLAKLNVTDAAAWLFSFILRVLHIPPELSHAFITGLFEITIGSQAASEADAALLFQVVIASFILAFSGFSIQAQVASIFAETDIRFKPFFIARMLHGLFAAGFTVLLWQPLYVSQTWNPAGKAIEVFNMSGPPGWTELSWQWVAQYGSLITLLSLLLYILLLLRKIKFPVNQ